MKIRKKSGFILLYVFFVFGHLGVFASDEGSKIENPPIQWQQIDDVNPNFKSAQTIKRIAFGSCCDLKRDKEQKIFEAVLKTEPDLWIWAGDAIYADTESMKLMRKLYEKQTNIPSYKKLSRQCSIIGTWDDHDYGANNAGKHYRKRKKSQKEFLNFLNEPKTSSRRKQKGVYASYLCGQGDEQIKIILLDCRYHKEVPSKKGDMLGHTQWQWLESQLKNSTAQTHIIVSSIQVIPKDHRFEKWSDYPKSKKRLFELIAKHKTPGVLFISGDRHIAEISKVKYKIIGYPTYDITSSGLTHSWSDLEQEENRYRVGNFFPQLNFGLIDIDFSNKTISLQIRDINSEIALEQSLNLKDLQTP